MANRLEDMIQSPKTSNSPIQENPAPIIEPITAPVLASPVPATKEKPAIIKFQETTVVPPMHKITVPTIHAIHPGIAASIKTAQTFLAPPRGPVPIIAPIMPAVTVSVLNLKPAKRPNSTIPVQGVVVNPNTVTVTQAFYSQTKTSSIAVHAPKTELLPQPAPAISVAPHSPEITRTTKKSVLPDEDGR